MNFFHRYNEILLFYIGNDSLYNTYLGAEDSLVGGVL